MSQHSLKRHKVKSLPNDAQCIQFETGNIRPLFVASKDIEKVIVGFNKKTAANLRCQKKGPRFYMVGGTPYYKVSDLEEYFGKNPVETFNSEER
jgi:hypothetical protein